MTSEPSHASNLRILKSWTPRSCAEALSQVHSAIRCSAVRRVRTHRVPLLKRTFFLPCSPASMLCARFSNSSFRSLILRTFLDE